MLVMSHYKICTEGVAQGSILDPLLFILYTTKLPTVINESLLFSVYDILIMRGMNPRKYLLKRT